jgi:WD40 repeat protein
MVWDVVTGEHTATMAGHARSVSQCAFSPDGSRVVTASADGTLKLWDPRLAAPACSPVGHTGGVNACAFSQDGSRLVSGGADGTVKVWDAEKMAVLRTLTHHLDDVYHHTVSGCAFSPDGSLIVSAGSDGTLRLWDANDGSEIVALRHPYPLGGGSGAKHDVAKCGFSPDGLRIVACSDDATLSVWDVRTGERVHDMRGHDGAVTDCAFSSDGHWIASASADRTLMLWDARTGAPARTLVGHTAAVQSCAFSPDGHWLVSAGADRTLKLWDADHRFEIVPATRTLAGHTDGVLACTFSSDGRWIISAGADGSVRLWDAERGGEVARLPVTGRVRTVAAHPWLVRAAFGEENGIVGAADVIGMNRFSKRASTREPTNETLDGRSARLLFMLGKANATTLHGRTQVAAAAILHERKNPTRLEAWEIADKFVQQDKAPGWVPAELTVDRETPVEMVLRHDTASLTGPEANAILADTIARLVPDVDLSNCACIGFSGDNDALGHAYYAILAR